jgi:hypothetical protein
LPFVGADDVPLDPTAPDARQWLIDELSHNEYQAAKPNLFDQAVTAFLDWLAGLQAPVAPGAAGLGLPIVITVLIGVIVIAFLVFGVPRLRRRSALLGSLFGDDDARSAAELRASSERAAADGDYTSAIIERFRAIARALSVRTVVTVSPGTTAHGFARRAAAAFPDEADALATAATDFDDVRYLDRLATATAYERMLLLDARLEAAAPVLATVDS